MTDRKLRELGRELPWDRPDPSRREAVRAALLLSAEDAPPRRGRRGPVIAGVAFAGGAVAAAAIALLVVRADRTSDQALRAHVTASPAAELEHSVIPTPTGSDEVVRVHAGTVRIAAPAAPGTDRVRVQTRDAAVEGVGEYEVAVVRDRLASVTVRSGTARVTVVGHTQAVFLSAGQTWRATRITADLVAPDTGSSAAVASAELPGEPSVAHGELSVGHGEPPPANGEPVRGASPAISAAPRRELTREPAAGPSRHAVVAESAATNTGASKTSVENPRSGATGEPATPPRKKASSKASEPPERPVTRPAPELRTPPARTAAKAESRERRNGSSVRTPSSDEIARIGREPLPGSAQPITASPSDPLLALANTERAAVPPASRAPSPTEHHFQAGWALLRAGKLREAATELGVAADAGDRDPLAADARYFQAVALIRAGAGRDAETALVAFLDRAPTSLRRGRAAVMLARLIAARGDVKSARAWFESALRDPDPEVAVAAQAGLDALPR